MKAYSDLPREANVQRFQMVRRFEDLFKRVVPCRENVGKWLTIDFGDYFFLMENKDALTEYARPHGYSFYLMEGKLELRAMPSRQGQESYYAARPRKYYVMFRTKEK